MSCTNLSRCVLRDYFQASFIQDPNALGLSNLLFQSPVHRARFIEVWRFCFPGITFLSTVFLGRTTSNPLLVNMEPHGRVKSPSSLVMEHMAQDGSLEHFSLLVGPGMDQLKIVDERQTVLRLLLQLLGKGIFCLPGLLSCWHVSQECMGPSCCHLLTTSLRKRLTQRKYESGNGQNQTPTDIIKCLDLVMPEVTQLLFFFSGMSQGLLFFE